MSTLTLNPALTVGRPAARPQPRAQARQPLVARAAGPHAPATRLTRRGRVAVFVLLLVTLVTAAALLVRAPASAGSPSGPAAAAPVADRFTVRPGQTLWQIAQRVAPTDDPRAMVARIKEMNGLSTSAIQAGQVLLVPAR